SLFDAGPAFSPDGRTLAFVRASTLSVADLYLLKLSSDLYASGEPSRLTFWNHVTTSPAWTPDGSEIMVASGRWDASGLWRVAVSGTRPPRRLELAGNDVGCWGSPLVARRTADRLRFESWRAMGDIRHRCGRRRTAPADRPPSRRLLCKLVA